MANELDLMNRDPHMMNHFLKVEFIDTFGEPDKTHSSDCIWKNSFKCFTCSKNCIYTTLTTICGIFIALYWGCTFGCISFEIIWCVSPCMRLFHILLHPVKKILSICILTCCGPFMETYGMIFSRIHIVNSIGKQPKPLDQI